jgi:hypothetical protein
MNAMRHRQVGDGKRGFARVPTIAPNVMRLLTVGLGLLVVLGSSGAGASDRFERIREKAGELAVAVNRAKAQPLAEGKDSEMEKAYGGYAYLLTPSKLEELQELINEATDEAERVRRERTAAILRHHAIRSRVAPVVDNYRNALRDNSISVEEGDIVLLGLDHRIGLQPDRDVRRKWWLAASQLYTAINVYQRSLLADLDTEAQKLGYAGYYPVLTEVEGWDLPLLKSTAESFLEASAAAYETQLEQWAQSELEMEVRKMRTYDADRLFFFPELSAGVKKFKVLDVATKSLKETGCDLKKQRTLKTNLRDKKNKLPTARAFQTQAGKAEVTMIPSGMLSDLQDFLGALGEAEFYFLMPGELPFEQAYTGTNILPSVYRALFEMICEEPAWVSRHLKLDGATPDEVAAAFRFRRLANVRRAAGNFLFALRLHENPQIDPEQYNEVMQRTMLWRRIANDADTYLRSNDDFRCGGFVLGQAIAAQIREALKAEWGPEWFRHEGLCERLEQGAAQGYAITLEQFLAIWGIEALDPSVLAAQLTTP